MTSADFLDVCTDLALLLLAISMALVTLRIAIGPSLPDRVLGLDTVVVIGIGFIAVIGIKTGFYLYVDVAIALGLVGFLTTVAFARYILVRGEADEETPDRSP